MVKHRHSGLNLGPTQVYIETPVSVGEPPNFIALSLPIRKVGMLVPPVYMRL